MNDSKRRAFFLTALSTILIAGCGGGAGGCGEQKPGDQGDQMVQLNAPMVEEEGPQYQTPTTENLQPGKAQKFPTKYPARRYPNSRVVMAHVEPNLRPGQHNVVLLNSSDNQKVIARYYNEDLTKNGWKVVYASGNSAYSQIKYQKGDQEVEVRVFDDPYGKQHVQLLSGPFKPDVVYDKHVKGENPSPVGEN
jgi:hypothetical protein